MKTTEIKKSSLLKGIVTIALFFSMQNFSFAQNRGDEEMNLFFGVTSSSIVGANFVCSDHGVAYFFKTTATSVSPRFVWQGDQGQREGIPLRITAWNAIPVQNRVPKRIRNVLFDVRANLGEVPLQLVTHLNPRDPGQVLLNVSVSGRQVKTDMVCEWVQPTTRP